MVTRRPGPKSPPTRCRRSRARRPVTETAPGLRHTSLVAVLPLAAVALAALVLAPAPIAIIGALALAVAIGLAPWMAASLVVLTLPYYLHPRSFGGIELSLTEATILLS